MTLGGNSKEQLRSVISRIEHLEDEKKQIADDIRDVYAEAKGNGFDTKALRAVVRMRRQDAQKRAEHEAILETYMHALGMLADTDLGQAAISRALQDTPANLPDVDTSNQPF